MAGRHCVDARNEPEQLPLLVSWPHRIQVCWDRGPVNSKGVDLFSRPWWMPCWKPDSATLVTLDQLGPAAGSGRHRNGWPKRETAARFADYVRIMAQCVRRSALPTGLLFNRPYAFTDLGYWKARTRRGPQGACWTFYASHAYVE